MSVSKTTQNWNMKINKRHKKPNPEPNQNEHHKNENYIQELSLKQHQQVKQ